MSTSMNKLPSGKKKKHFPVVPGYLHIQWRRVGHVACMGEMINFYKVLIGRPEGKNHSGNIGIDGEMITE